jgi:3-hydroxyacyl-CoA dehydrogenase
VPELVTVTCEGPVAIVTVDNPPVNALKHDMRVKLIEAFRQARVDPAVEAVVLTAAGRTFIAGADITEFDKPPRTPTTGDVIEAIETMPKPVVAALHGTPLGGGLEIALGCHFRIAAPGTKLGLPEIKLGLIPGAGGTQRLPRLVGMPKAMDMILTGNPIPAEQALDIGLIDEVAAGDMRDAGIAFARRVVAEKRPLAKARDRDDKLAALRSTPDQFDELAAPYLKRGRGLDAPKAAIEALRWNLQLAVDEALKRERETFIELRNGDQAKAQRHIFFAEREAAKIAGLPKDVKGRDIKRAAVIGAGTMGGGIAMNFANAGCPVTIVETSDEALKRGLGTIEKNYRSSASRGTMSAEAVEKRMALITGTTDIAAVADADLIVEAVFEDIEVKRDVFTKLDRLAKPDAVLATNTSYLDVNAIADMTARPSSVVGMHFFSPANVMKLLEVVRGAKTSPETLATAMSVGRKIGKVPVVVGVCHGFVGNRMLRVRSVEAERLLLEGALPQDVDGALTEFGFPMGPFAMGDLAGLDISWRMRKAQGAHAEIADQLCEQGRFGQKTGKGFYLYQEGSRTPVPDPEVEQLIIATSHRLGVARRTLDRKEITERLIFPMINEGARILEEGIAQRASDIDVIWVYGYGFPAWRGGPMFYADKIGLRYICDRLAEFVRQTGDRKHEPAPLLARLAAADQGFASLSLKAG